MSILYADTKDEVKLEHDCLKPWHSLKDDQSMSYDCNVSDFILGIIVTPCQTKR